MFFSMKKSVLNGLLLTASLALPLQAKFEITVPSKVTTQGLKKYFDLSTKAETGLYLAAATGVQVSKLCDPRPESRYKQPRTDNFLNRYDTAINAGMTLLGKPSDVVGSALELPKSWPKELSQAVAVLSIGKVPLEIAALQLFVKSVDTAMFNKVNQLVNARFPGADKQAQRRVMRVVVMAMGRYFTQLMSTVVINACADVVPSKISTASLSSWNDFNHTVLQSFAGQETIEHILTECAGAVLANMIDDSVKSAKKIEAAAVAKMTKPGAEVVVESAPAA